MGINYRKASLTISAGFISQIPGDLPHVVMSGRSNVGKSSLINALTGNRKLARTSSMPGKTTTINFYRIGDAFYFADLPGYGYSARSNAVHEKWSAFTEEYLRLRTFSFVIQLVDLRIGATADDEHMIGWMNAEGIDYIVAASKADKLSRTARETAAAALRGLPLVRGHEVAAFSSQTGEGLDSLKASIEAHLMGG